MSVETFRFRALDEKGVERKGVVAATSADIAARELRGRGWWPISVERAGGKEPAGVRFSGRSWFGQVSQRDVAVFTRQLATLLRAGMPLVRALEVLARHESRTPLRAMITALADRVRGGGTLSAAMAEQARVFPDLFINTVRAGEATGALEPVLDRLARFAEKSQQLRAKVKAAMIYPAVVLTVAGGILAGLLMFVVPRFQQIFADLLKGAPLPPLTQAVLSVSQGVREHGLLGAGIIVLGWVVMIVARRTQAGRAVADGITLYLPVFGALARKVVVARFARTFGTLLGSGVPILNALEIARTTCGNARVADALGNVQARVQAGESVARPLEDIRVMPPMVVSLVDVGEHSGQLPAMLGRIAEVYEDEVDSAVEGLGALLEPFLILFLAAVVGTIVVALFLPMVRIVQLLS